MTRRGYVIATCLAVMGTTLASLVPVPLRLIWNASASVPIGFYTIAPADRIEVPDLVAVLPPEPIADPLPQALILTAIVIGFGAVSFAIRRR